MHVPNDRIPARQATLSMRLIVGFAFAAGVSLASYGWIAVSPLSFRLGLLVCAGPVGWLSARRIQAGATATVLLLNTLVCLLLGVAFVDFLLLATESDEAEGLVSYSFREAKGDPAVFLRWHERNVLEIEKNRRRDELQGRGGDPAGFRIGAGQYMDSKWWINKLGFRGAEISRAKGDRYRIVASGESTTFGATLEATDRPWPEVLEELIETELVCEKSVQVINAGVPGRSLKDNLARLERDVISIDPDLIISYHGYNGFVYILSEIPTVKVGRLPSTPPRPSRLLTRIESSLRVAWFKRRYRAARAIDASVLDSDVRSTRYAAYYREFVRAARGSGTDVVLATFNMAVTPDSPEEVVLFYEPVFPDVRARMLVNRLHTRLVFQVAKDHRVLAIDTSPGLDGAYEDAYTDLIHFTQVGRDRLAANIFEGIRNTLSEGSSRCEPRRGLPVIRE